MIAKIYKHFMHDSLYRNSIFLMLSTGVMAFFGFFFWIICARLFTNEQIGLATTLISITSLITTFSLLGLNVSLIRYLPTSDTKNEKINTSFTLIILTTIILSIVYLLGVQIFSPKLYFLREHLSYSLLFILLMIFMSLNIAVESVFIAYRSTKYVFYKNLLLGILKLSLPMLFVSLGAYGIFLSFSASILIAVLFSFIFLIIRFAYIIKATINKPVVKQMMKFSFGNYLAGFIGALPMNVLPVIITNKLGATTSAYFYIAMMIASLLYIIPIAASQSLFAEGSHDQNELHKSLNKAMKIIALLLIPAIIITIFFGNYILLAFGKSYSTQGFTFLRMLAFSGIFFAISSVGSTILNVQHKVQYIVLLNLLNFILILGFSYLFISSQLVGIGLAWIIGQIVVAALYLFIIRNYFI